MRLHTSVRAVSRRRNNQPASGVHPESERVARLLALAQYASECIAISRALRESVASGKPESCPLSISGCEPEPGTVCDPCTYAVPC